MSGGKPAPFRSMLTGPVFPILIRLGIPMMLEMFFQSLLSIVDIFFIGKLGSEAVGAVGISVSIMVMIRIAAALGAGDTVTPLWANFLLLWVVQGFFGYVVALPMGYGETGLWGRSWCRGCSSPV